MSRSYVYKRYSPEFKAKAVALRRQGYSLYELRDLPNVRLATVQGWVRNVPLSKKAKKRIRQRILEGGKVARACARVVNGQTLEAWKRGIQESSRTEVRRGRLTREVGRLLCASMYSCEGAKYPSARRLGFGNSDPRMIQLFLRLLRRYFAVDEEKFRCQVFHRWDQNLRDLIRYWSGITGIPPRQFYPSKPDRRTKGKPTLRKDYRGVCSITYFSTTLQFTLQSIGEALMESCGKEEMELEGFEPSASSMPSRRAPTAPQPHELKSEGV